METLASIINHIDSPYKYHNVPVPRVTKILSIVSTSDGLMYWSNSLGFKRQSYSKTIKFAADIGAQCHKCIDLFLSNNYDYEPPFDMHTQARFAYESFLKWWNDISNNNVKVLLHEYSLSCRFFGGTLDGLYEINGKKYLVDYKTSNHVNFKYTLQLAAYRYMLKHEMNIDIDGCIILQLSKNDISYNEYFIDLSTVKDLEYMNYCERTFFDILDAYNNVMRVEKTFTNFKWG